MGLKTLESERFGSVSEVVMFPVHKNRPERAWVLPVVHAQGTLSPSGKGHGPVRAAWPRKEDTCTLPLVASNWLCDPG